jgi:hypothetical protein
VSTQKRKGKLPPFVPVIRTTMASPAWRATSFGARCLYIILCGWLGKECVNNGKIFRSYRDACTDLGTRSLNSVGRWYRELQHYGFIVQTAGAHLGVDGDGTSAHWRLTEHHSYDGRGNHVAPTRDFDRWDGALFKDSLKTESRRHDGYTPSPPQRHTGPPWTVEIAPEVYPPQRHRLVPEVYPPQRHNCLPLPTALTPHAEDLTGMVLKIVHEQLDERDCRKRRLRLGSHHEPRVAQRCSTVASADLARRGMRKKFVRNEATR